VAEASSPGVVEKDLRRRCVRRDGWRSEEVGDQCRGAPSRSRFVSAVSGGVDLEGGECCVRECIGVRGGVFEASAGVVDVEPVSDVVELFAVIGEREVEERSSCDRQLHGRAEPALHDG
jgi:hypothetical protein